MSRYIFNTVKIKRNQSLIETRKSFVDIPTLLANMAFSCQSGFKEGQT